MAAKSRKSGAKKRRGPVMSPAEKVAYTDIKQGIKHVEKSIGEVQKGLRRAEKAIEADAKARARALRREGKTQIASLKAKRREAAQLMRNLSAAAEGSWQDVKQSADQVLADARATASSIVERIRTALAR
jgi:phage terminase small subunit